MYKFTVANKVWGIPETAEELTLGQFSAMQLATDEMSELTAILGEVPTVNCESKEDFNRLNIAISNAYKLIGLLKQDILNTVNSGLLLTTPKAVNIMGLTIPVKENFVNVLPYWGYVHTKQAIINRAKLGKDEKFDATDLIPGILAHNMYALVTKEAYNEEKAEEFTEVINEMSFIDAIRLGNFFLLQQKKLWVSRRKRWIIHLNLLKSKLVSKFLINTARSTPLKRYQWEILLNGTK